MTRRIDLSTFDGEPLFDSIIAAIANGYTGRRVLDRGSGKREVIHAVHGRLHRADGPAVVHYRADGTVERSLYLLDGDEHRVGGPAIEVHDENGDPTGLGQWFRRGERHRISGPAEDPPMVRGRLAGRGRRWWIAGERLGSRRKALEWIAVRGEDGITSDLHETEFEEAATEFGALRVFEVISAGVVSSTGVREVLAIGAPVDWVRAWESGDAPGWMTT